MKYIVAVLCIVWSLPAFAADISAGLQRHDKSNDGRLDAAELRAYFLEFDPEIVRARAEGEAEAKLQERANDLAVDALTAFPTTISVTIKEASAFVNRRNRMLQPDVKIGWRTLAFRRMVLDTADPRGSRIRRPSVVSYIRNNEAADKDQINVWGGVQLFQYRRDFGLNKNHTLAVGVGIEAEVDGSKKSVDSTIEGGIPITYEWSSTGDSFLDSVAIGLTPKFGTDRAFNREVRELVLGVAPGISTLKLGYLQPIIGNRESGFGAWLAMQWQAGLLLEQGHIADAAGNEKLARLAASEPRYFRLTPTLSVALVPERLVPRLTLSSDYYQRFDETQDWSRGYSETRATYDLSKNIALTVLYAAGHKPPDFAKTSKFIVGIGILK